MRIDRRLTIIGVMLVVLSMTMATQYVTTSVGYTYTIAHPSNADIRFIASDNNSDDNIAILRLSEDFTTAEFNTSGYRELVLKLGGNFTENYNNTYTAAFGIVNEENFTVNITHVYISGVTGADYMQIWLHGDRDAIAGSDGTSVLIWNNGTNPGNFDNTTCVWQLADGNNDPDNMNNHATAIETRWNSTAGVRYSLSNVNAVNGSDDYVWVQVSVNVPQGASAASVTGTIYFGFSAVTSGIYRE